MWALLVASLAGCKDEKAAGEAAASATVSAAGTGEAAAAGGAACDNYVAYLKTCAGKNPAIKATLEAQEKALADASGPAKEQMQDGCAMGLATMKQSGQCD
jgi:hypothetical protein